MVQFPFKSITLVASYSEISEKKIILVLFELESSFLILKCLMVLGTYGSIFIQTWSVVLPIYSIAQTDGQTDRWTDRFRNVLGRHIGSLDPKKDKNSISSSRHHHLFGWWKKSIKIGF